MATKLTKDQLTYLGALFDCSLGFRSVSTTGAVCISHTNFWTAWLVETYGGTTEEFTSKRGNTVWGWFLTVEERSEMFEKLCAADAIRVLDGGAKENLRAKFKKTLDKKAAKADG